MSGLWQSVAAWCIILGAIAYLARRAWLRATSPTPPGCPTCRACRRQSPHVRFVRFGDDSPR